MRIALYKVPTKITRDPRTGEVKYTMDTNAKVFVSEEPLAPDARDIVVMSKKISDNNNMQTSMVTKTMGASENEKEVFLMMKYLE